MKPVIRLSWYDPQVNTNCVHTQMLPLTIGQNKNNDIVLAGDHISDEHAKLDYNDNQVILTDFNRSKGTQIVLQDGDTFIIDIYEFTFSLKTAVKTLPSQAKSSDDTSTVVMTKGDILGDESSNPAPQSSQAADDTKTLAPIRKTDFLPSSSATISAPPRSSDDEKTVVDLNKPGLAKGISKSSKSKTTQATLVMNTPDDLDSNDSYQFPPPIFEQAEVSIEGLKQIELPIEETTYLAIGGGVGSFAWADHLIIHGVNPADMVSIGFEKKPYGRYKRLCKNSQIPDYERLRSDSGSTPDNIWGWPGYAVREILSNLKQGHWGQAAYISWQIFTEPMFTPPFTPKAGDVYASIDREAKRIGWDNIWRYGRVRAIRKSDDGRYVVAYSQSTPQNPKVHKLIIAPYLHIAVGYPGFRFLDDLQAYREQTEDFRSVVNAYEDHKHVYNQLLVKGGTVLVRGRGIVASRVIQRLYEARLKNPQIGILHLIRNPKPYGTHYKYARRLTEHHFEHQPYNFPKSTFGGDFLFELARASDEERAELLDIWGGTTTAKRSDWQQIINSGLDEGWYQIRFGHVEQVKRKNGKLATFIRSKGLIQEESHFFADFIIDATGLDAELEHNPLLRDILHIYGLEKNAKGRLKTNENFELEGMRNGPGRVYAAGAMTFGGLFAAVDSFVGLQYTAQLNVKDLIKLGVPGVRSLNPIRSAKQWLRWARGVKP